MSFKIVERNGNWGVFNDSSDTAIIGDPLTYEQYQRYQNTPHRAADTFHRGPNGRLVEKPKKKDVK